MEQKGGSEPILRRHSKGEGLDDRASSNTDWNLWFLRNCPRVSLRASNGQFLRLAFFKRYMGSLKAFPRMDQIWHEDDGFNIFCIDDERLHEDMLFGEKEVDSCGEKNQEKTIQPEESKSDVLPSPRRATRVAIQSCANRCFVSSTKEGNLMADCLLDTPGPHEIFDVESCGKYLVFRNFLGAAMGVDLSGGDVNCFKKSPGPTELFRIEIKVHIQACNGLYISAAKNFVLGVTNRTKPSKNETFTLEVQKDSFSIKSDVLDKYWVAELNGNLTASTPAKADRKSPRENFTMRQLDTVDRPLSLEERSKLTAGAPLLRRFAIQTVYDNIYVYFDGTTSRLKTARIPANKFLEETADNEREYARSQGQGKFHQELPYVVTLVIKSPPQRFLVQTLSFSGISPSPFFNTSPLLSPGVAGKEKASSSHTIPLSTSLQSIPTHPKQAEVAGWGLLSLSSNKVPTSSPGVVHKSQSLRFDFEDIDDHKGGVVRKRSSLTEGRPKSDRYCYALADEEESKEEGEGGSEPHSPLPRPPGGYSGGRSDDGEEDDDDNYHNHSNNNSGNMELSSGGGEAPSEGDGMEAAYVKEEEHNYVTLDPGMLKAAEEAQKKKEEEEETMYALWQVPFEDLQLTNVVLGKGFFGEVRKAKWNGTTVAVKVIYRHSFRTRNDAMMFDKEVEIMRKIRHPNILQFLGNSVDKEKGARYIVCEFMKHGSLHDFIEKNRRLLQEDDCRLALAIAIDVAKGMCYLHSMKPPILHRDLTTKNILIDANHRAKISDFGLSRAVGNGLTPNTGNLMVMAPEVYKGSLYAEPADVYSYSFALYELATGMLPMEESVGVMQFAASCALNKFRPKIPPGCPEFWQRWMSRCWEQEPQDRPAFKEILGALKVQRKQMGHKE